MVFMHEVLRYAKQGDREGGEREWWVVLFISNSCDDNGDIVTGRLIVIAN